MLRIRICPIEFMYTDIDIDASEFFFGIDRHPRRTDTGSTVGYPQATAATN
jgi:hypothetical protein